jgi:hypothetical protein
MSGLPTRFLDTAPGEHGAEDKVVGRSSTDTRRAPIDAFQKRGRTVGAAWVVRVCVEQQTTDRKRGRREEKKIRATPYASRFAMIGVESDEER